MERVIVENPDDLTEKDATSVTRDKYIKRKPQVVPQEVAKNDNDAAAIGTQKKWAFFSSKKVQENKVLPVNNDNDGGINNDDGDGDDDDDGMRSENNSTIATNESPQGSPNSSAMSPGPSSPDGTATTADGSYASPKATDKSLRQKAMVKAGIQAEKARRALNEGKK